LGFHNFQAALNAHYSDSDTGSGPGAGFNVVSSHKRPGRHIPPSPTPSIPDSVSDEGNLSLLPPKASAPAKTRKDFYDGENGEGDEIPNISSELGGDADDEIDEEEDCIEHDEEDVPRKPSKRYTRLDFEFLQEDWLDPVDGSSEDISTCSD
jgi:hypothetical protein